MAEDDTRFAGAIPALYEQYLVPLIFAPYARDHEYPEDLRFHLQRSADERA